jgi:hypothetical protein
MRIDAPDAPERVSSYPLQPTRVMRGPNALLAIATYGALAAGVALRLTQYLANSSLSLDESFLALNIIRKSPTGLLGALDFNQAAPIGFLEAEKLASILFGNSEYSLRLIPFLSSLVSLIFFYLAARRLLTSFGLLVAVGAFALLDPLIYYSATAKQYELDVAAATLVYALAIDRPALLDRRRLLVLGAIGAIVVWFSHAAAFVLAALGVVLALRAVRERRFRQLPSLAVVCGLWLASLGIEYLVSRPSISHVRHSFGDSGDHVFLAGGGSSPSWFGSLTPRLRYLAGLEDTASGQPILGSLPAPFNQAATLFILGFAVAGFVSLLARRVWDSLLLGLPLLFAALASAAGLYPLVGRTLLFALPSVALWIGEAATIQFPLSSRRSLAGRAGLGIGLAVLSVIAIGPALHAVNPRTNDDLKASLDYLADHRRTSDVLYVSQGAQYSLAYYHLCRCVAFDPAIVWPFAVTAGPSQTAPAIRSGSPRLVIGSKRVADGDFGKELEPLFGHSRVWVLLAGFSPASEHALDAYLVSRGRAVERFSDSGKAGTRARLVLYDLRQKA